MKTVRNAWLAVASMVSTATILAAPASASSGISILVFNGSSSTRTVVSDTCISGFLSDVAPSSSTGCVSSVPSGSFSFNDCDVIYSGASGGSAPTVQTTGKCSLTSAAPSVIAVTLTN